MYYVYFAKSLKNNKVYVGVTNKDPKIRVKEHNDGSNCWTQHNKPFKLIYYERYYCKKDAYARENFYKTGFGNKNKKLIVEKMSNDNK